MTFDLDRFIEAQQNIYEMALGELRRGQKTSHWMWFVFPQIAGLGHSHMSQKYAISSVSEAQAYLAHPVLGSRLAECVDAMLDVQAESAAEILGEVDARKLLSSMTLFTTADPDNPKFPAVLSRFYNGQRDNLTMSIIG